MGLCTLGTIILILFVALCIQFKQESLIIIGALIAAVLFSLGIFSAPYGYEDTQLMETIELKPLNDALIHTEANQTYYLSIKDEGNTRTYTYCKEEEPQKIISNNDIEYRLMTLSSNVTVIPQEMDVPIVEIYETKPVASFWSYAKYREKVAYIIKVPESSIAHIYE